MPAHPVVAVITDEVSHDVGAVLAFMQEQRVERVDIRAVDGRNVLLFDDRELVRLADALSAAGLSVGCYCSPLLKWPRPGEAVPEGTNFHGFDPNAMSPETAMSRSFEVADALGAGQVRIFSYLRYDGFSPGDLDADLDQLLALADRHDVDLVLENEHVCNVATLGDLVAVLGHRQHPRLKAAVDIANQVSADHAPPADTVVAEVARFAGTVHVKDLDTSGAYVPLGDGTIDHRSALATLLKDAPDGELPIAIETHMPEDGRRATAASLDALRRMLAEIGG